ncbi:ferritin family protein [Thermodesulfobacteriota bacterium]
MKELKLSEVLDKAIQREEEAYLFYMDILDKIEDKSAKETIEWIAGEEKQHKAFLVNYREGRYRSDALRMSDVVHYKIAEHQEKPDIAKNMRREDVFLVASHRELNSHMFYSELAGLHPAGETKEMLLKMANEELKHKEKMEYLYANTAFPQTAGG